MRPPNLLIKFMQNTTKSKIEKYLEINFGPLEVAKVENSVISKEKLLLNLVPLCILKSNVFVTTILKKNSQS